MTLHYVLDGRTPVAEPNLLLWSYWFETNERHVARTMVGGYTVSTVFLGLDHSHGWGAPVLFETMIFGADKEAANGDLADYQLRYRTWEEAEEGHRDTVAMVESRLK